MESPVETVIVEDEEASRKRLRRLLTSFGDIIKVVGEAGDGISAVEIITELRPQLLFLDIVLPGIDGLQVLKKITYQPAVIFTSAYDQYAIEAFQAIAIDYLLKPIDSDMLKRAIDKLKKVGFRQDALSEKIDYLLQATSSATHNRIPLRLGDHIDLVPLDDIIYFRSDNKYTKVKTTSKDYLIDTPLTEIESKLNPKQFIRIHRSTIVNINWVSGLHRWFGGRLKLSLRDHPEIELIVSRSYTSKLTKW